MTLFMTYAYFYMSFCFVNELSKLLQLEEHPVLIICETKRKIGKVSINLIYTHIYTCTHTHTE